MSKAKTSKRKWRLWGGVGFDPLSDEASQYGPHPHWVVLMQSMHSGTTAFGPFLNEDAAHRWVREESDSELYARFGRSSVPGVTFHVDSLEIPTTRA